MNWRLDCYIKVFWVLHTRSRSTQLFFLLLSKKFDFLYSIWFFRFFLHSSPLFSVFFLNLIIMIYFLIIRVRFIRRYLIKIIMMLFCILDSFLQYSLLRFSDFSSFYPIFSSFIDFLYNSVSFAICFLISHSLFTLLFLL